MRTVALLTALIILAACLGASLTWYSISHDNRSLAVSTGFAALVLLALIRHRALARPRLAGLLPHITSQIRSANAGHHESLLDLADLWLKASGIARKDSPAAATFVLLAAGAVVRYLDSSDVSGTSAEANRVVQQTAEAHVRHFGRAATSGEDRLRSMLIDGKAWTDKTVDLQAAAIAVVSAEP